jgi:hypothetical protein
MDYRSLWNPQAHQPLRKKWNKALFFFNQGNYEVSASDNKGSRRAPVKITGDRCPYKPLLKCPSKLDTVICE